MPIILAGGILIHVFSTVPTNRVAKTPSTICGRQYRFPPQRLCCGHRQILLGCWPLKLAHHLRFMQTLSRFYREKSPGWRNSLPQRVGE